MSRQLTKKDGKTIKNWIGDNLQLAIIIVLVIGICLTLLSSLLVAKYTKGTSATDSARVARFAITTADGSDSDKINLNYSNTSKTYSFTVKNTENTNTNETATKYDVILTFGEALPDYLTLSMKSSSGSNVSPTKSTSGTSTVYTFSNVGTFTAGTARTDTVTLTCTLDSTKATANINKTWSDVTIGVKATQVD